MKKRLNRLLNNKGMTLTELVVAMFLTSVILTIAMGLLVPVKNLMNTLKSNAHMDTISSTVEEYIRGTLQTAKNLKFITLGDDNSVDAHVSDITDFFNKNGSKSRALAVLNVSDDDTPLYRIYDFEYVSDYSTLKGLLNKYSANEYRVFNDAFYEGTSCAVEFYKAGSTRLQVASQCYRNGESINRKHVLSFNLLNGGSTGIASDIDGEGVYTNVDIEAQTDIEGHCYLILYTLNEI